MGRGDRPAGRTVLSLQGGLEIGQHQGVSLLEPLAGGHTCRLNHAALGIDREDAPTQTALIEEAIRLLAARRETKGKAKR